MQPGFVLVHSPLLGPASWGPAAAALDAVVPSLLGVTDGSPPFWPSIARRVADAVTGDRPVVLVGHSNAGYFLPTIAAALRQPVAGCILVDGRLPARTGPTPVVAPGGLDRLRSDVDGDRLRPWTTWWPEAELEQLIPDPRIRQEVVAEQPRLPVSYYAQRLPVPAGWGTVPCGYLQFSPPYAEAAAQARERGWLVEHLPGLHLHQLVDPRAVSARLIAMRSALTGDS